MQLSVVFWWLVARVFDRGGTGGCCGLVWAFVRGCLAFVVYTSYSCIENVTYSIKHIKNGSRTVYWYSQSSKR